MRGVAATVWWPDAPGAYTQDDVRVEPALGAAVLAGGRGACAQGQAASKLALWSVLGELAAPDAPVERRLARGLERAGHDVQRCARGRLDR